MQICCTYAVETRADMSTIFRGWLSDSVLGTLDAITDNCNAIYIVACTKVFRDIAIGKHPIFQCIWHWLRTLRLPVAPEAALLFNNGARFRVHLDCIAETILRRRMNERTLENASSLEKTARRLTDDIQSMSNYRALYNEIQVRARYWTLIKAVTVHFPSVF